MNKQSVIIFRGIVQGVFLRLNIQKLALKLGLVGWVKNELDGSVKVKVQGPEQNIKQLIQLINQGLGAAKIDNFEVDWENELVNFKNFSIKY
ncbi:acylphosphatase [Patescibacteria group bacterium]|nr:acylphosphatase [Patescibacteria group bacterium]